ncbi:multidomain presynaptic cytomatrix related protein [Metarhizium guizhouense ARSEF 977]|uniref:Autophagy-related protein 29 n=1 Tax=Metarhizium guizhouense (strain ARSEF 977) TaxID=1276136 RepID=A0A0B4H6R9_METGA|nr:multidomain presynaptic cytomatrix related protein [Metarhizium guizhouense ARSEF 977]
MSQPKYTVFVRVPIPRGDFVDPPPVHWDSSKDEALWKILSGATQTEIDWSQVAERFDVPVDFLLKQVAYLTERHASQVRAQVRKATAAAKGSAAPSPIPGAEPTGSSYQRAPSALSGRRDSPMPRPEGALSGTPLSIPIRPNMSRDTSGNTTILKDVASSSSPRHGTSFPGRAVDQAGRKRLSSLPIPSPTAKSPEPQTDHRHNEAISPGPAESSSNESSDEESSPAQSRIIRRPPRFQQQEAAKTYPDDGDDELEPAFQPFQASDQPGQDLASTLRGDGPASSRRNHKNPMREYLHQSQTSDDSSTGSPTAIPRPKSKESKIPGPLSPRRTAELAGRSPSGKGKASSREGSDGTPSMGSSFSDLDDASVTQSALEEALASHMNRGASSRFSISQAFRSRYTQG